MGSSKADDRQPPESAGKKGRRSQRDVGDALREVYHGAVAESVPQEMLDLLDKLG